MSKLRVYELAKELGVENKVVIDKAQELGFVSVKSHSNSLDPDEADTLRREFIRSAIGIKPDSEVVKKAVNQSTGETSMIVERRKGDVVRRRKQGGSDTQTSVPVLEDKNEAVIASDNEIQESVQFDKSLDRNTAERFASESQDSELIESEDLSDEAQDLIEDVLEATEEATTVEVKPGVGPKILGKIELPGKKVKQVKAKPTGKVVYTQKDFIEEDDDSSKLGKKKPHKKKELNLGDLVDYEGRSGKRYKTKNSKKSLAEQAEAESRNEIAPTRASKKVVKMATEAITVGELAAQLSVKAGEVITKLIGLGVMATINQAIDRDTATIVADDFGFTLEFTGFDETNLVQIEGIDDTSKMKARPPVVTVMGHVDHGKTSLLDRIRKSSVASKEHGGITQHIGAYQVTLKDNRQITFLDTPGHAAFTQMRARGAKVTDIVILVVAADDGVMPQTVEAINHAKAAEVPIIVAVNKIDKPSANQDRIKQQLAEHNLIPEDWGGDTMYCPVSALSGQGIEELLERVLLVAEIKELKANYDCRVKGTIIEARQEIGRGTVATVLVQAGTLKVGDIFVCGPESGRVRSMLDHNGNKITTAYPSTPVEITGLNAIPTAGDDFVVMLTEAEAREVAFRRADILRQKEALALAGGPISLEEFAKMAERAEAFELNLVIKADVQGSLEAVSDAVSKLSTDKVRVKVVHGAVGGVIESDVQLAIASKALIIGFGVRGEPRALAEAESRGIEVRFYRVIYELMDDVKKAMAGLLPPIRKEVSLGRAEVRDTFAVPKIGVVAGCYITEGMVKRGAQLRLVRDSRVVYEGKMLSLRRFKDDVKEVQTGYECGISFEGYNDIKAGDVIEAFEIKEEVATL